MSTTSRQSSPGSGQGFSSMNYQTSDRSTAWSGWVIFAATMMVLIGGFNIIDGLIAIFNSGYFGATHPLLLGNYQSWGWFNIIGGTVIVLAGLSLFTGSTWSRVVGIILAALTALSQLVFIAVFPFWALAVITLCVIVIYALAVNQEVA